MPSTTSSSVSSDLASSTVMTPSLPTFFMASARNLPISASPLAEMVPTWAISSFEVTFLEFLTRSATTASTARSIPRFRSIGFMPAATDLAPSRTIAAARTVAVVVPSPAASADLEATSRTICAPMFSNLSSSSISLATVTPSLVMRGAPYDLSSTTLRPFLPSVTRTAWVSMSTPRSILSRASTENRTSLAAIARTPSQFVTPSSEGAKRRSLEGVTCCRPSRLGLRPTPQDDRSQSGGLLAGFRLYEHAHDVAFLHDQVLDAVDLDLGAGPLAEQHAVAGLDIDRDELAGLVAGAGTDCHDPALLRLLLGGVRDDDAAGGLRLGVNAANDHAVVKRTEFHCGILLIGNRNGARSKLSGQVTVDLQPNADFDQSRGCPGHEHLLFGMAA